MNRRHTIFNGYAKEGTLKNNNKKQRKRMKMIAYD
jgi:hypothetical protein